MFDFYEQYRRIHRQVYGRDPCTREEWVAWCAQPAARQESPVDFDIETERRDGWGYQ